MPDYNPVDTENLVQRTTIVDDDLDEEKRGYNDVAKQFIREANFTDDVVLDKLTGLGSIVLAGVASVTTSAGGVGTVTVTLPVTLPSASYAVFLTPDGTDGAAPSYNTEARTTTTFDIRIEGTGGVGVFPLSWLLVF